MSDDARLIDAARRAIEGRGGLGAALDVQEFRYAFEGLWRRGDASTLILDAGQRAWVEAFRTGDGAATWMIGRQRGKSFAALTLACEEAVRSPGSIIRYAALTGKSAKAIVVPTLAQVLLGCPDDVRPEVREHEGTVEFQNGSVVTWAGTDNEQFDRLRGPRAHLVLLDESAFYADLERVESALLPQLTTTQGKALFLSTPPESIAHPFLARYRAAQGSGRAVHATVHDNPRLGPQGVGRIIRTEAARLGLSEADFVKSTFWRREYLAEIVTEETRAAVPAWTQEVAATQVRTIERPGFFDGYVAIDLGYSPDPSAALFGWHDVASNSLVIEDEIEHRSGTAMSFTKELKAKELLLWGTDRYEGTLLALSDELAALPEFLQRVVHRNAPRQPFLRVGDNDLQLLAEMAQVHGYAIFPPRKDDKALAVDFLNQLVGSGRIVIHPRCVRLREQLFSTVWNKARSSWERTAKDHGDLIDCLVYLARNVRWHRDCRPIAPTIPWGNKTMEQPRGWDGAFRKRQ